MSDIARANVWKRCGQRGVKRLIMVALADEVNSQGYAAFKHGELAEKCACEPETIGAYLRQLAAAGELEYAPATCRGEMSQVWLTPYGETLSTADDNPIKGSLAYGLPSNDNPVNPAWEYGLSDLSGVVAEPVAAPPTRDVLIPPPVQPKTGGTSGDVPPEGSNRDETWAPFHAVTAEDLTGDPNGWRDKRNGGVKAAYGQLAGKFGPPCRDDVTAAIALWRRFVESKKTATFRETGEPLWSAVTPRNVVEVAGRWVKDSAPALPPAPTDTRPPIGAILGPLGLSTSNPAKWPPHVLAAYADVAAQWGYAPSEAAR